MRLRSSLSIAFIVTGVVAAGCSSTGATTSNKASDGKHAITLVTIGYPDSDQTDPVTGAKQPGVANLRTAFKKDNPDTDLKIVNIPWGTGSTSYTAKTDAMLKANQACLYEMPGALGYGEKGMLVDLSTRIAKDSKFENVWGEQLEQAKSWGPGNPNSLFYLPASTGVRVINWDSEIFAHYGVEPLSETPTLDEVATKAAKLTGTDPVTQQKTYGFWYQGKYLAWQYLAVAHAMGANWGQVNADGSMTINWDTPEYLKALEWMVSMRQYAPKGALAADGMPQGFLTEKNPVAIIPDGEAGYFVSAQVANSDLAKRFRTSTNFKGPDGRGGLNAFSPLAMSKDCADKDAAWTAMKWLAGSAPAQKYYYQAAGLIPTRTDAQTIAPQLAALPEGGGRAIFKQVQSADRVYPWATQEPRWALQTALEAAMAGTKTPKQALEQAQAETKKWLAAK